MCVRSMFDPGLLKTKTAMERFMFGDCDHPFRDHLGLNKHTQKKLKIVLLKDDQ